jgi:hypothetical protein
MDTKSNAVGHKFLDICKCNNLYILNGRVGKDRNKGNFTFRNTSVIDYMAGSVHFFPFPSDFEVKDTTDHICTLKFLIDTLKSQKKNLFCSYIDFSAAFDKIWRVGLWNKLLKNGINGKLFNVIFNMYANIKSCVSLNGYISPFFKSIFGVRKEENLSPVLFSIYLNDLEEYLNSNNAGIELKRNHGSIDVYLKIFVLLYADDTVMVSEDEKTFQNMLNDFHQYCNQWKLTINMQKTKIFIFGTSRPDNYMFTMSGEKIKIVKEYKYLGVLFSSSCSFFKSAKTVNNSS